MLYKRLIEANKKSAKRWKFFHNHTLLAYPWIAVKVPLGAYRKKKGCECRGCSINKQREKKSRNEKERTINKLILKEEDIPQIQKEMQ